MTTASVPLAFARQPFFLFFYGLSLVPLFSLVLVFLFLGLLVTMRTAFVRRFYYAFHYGLSLSPVVSCCFFFSLESVTVFPVSRRCTTGRSIPPHVNPLHGASNIPESERTLQIFDITQPNKR